MIELDDYYNISPLLSPEQLQYCGIQYCVNRHTNYYLTETYCCTPRSSTVLREPWLERAWTKEIKNCTPVAHNLYHYPFSHCQGHCCKHDIFLVKKSHHLKNHFYMKQKKKKKLQVFLKTITSWKEYSCTLPSIQILSHPLFPKADLLLRLFLWLM